jgi:hypothetical protein
MRRTLVWVQLVIGWLPVWALYTLLMVSMHDTALLVAAFVAFRAVACAAILGLLAQRVFERLPWPHPFRLSFAGLHVFGALLFAGGWLVLTTLVESAFDLFTHGLAVRVPFVIPFLILGVWLYAMVAGVSYALHASARAARAEALAARSQLAALRGQLNPHFLFNALHTVVQLIPRRPDEAVRTAEQLAGLLRATIEEDRDLVPLAEEWGFVERYLALEQVRCGDRLVVVRDMTPEAREAMVPSFALQTLVENAVRHGVAPRIEPTTVTVHAALSSGMLTVSVHDSGAGADPGQLAAGPGTGLRRLRERLAVLFGARGGLDIASGSTGFTATLRIPQEPLDA